MARTGLTRIHGGTFLFRARQRQHGHRGRDHGHRAISRFGNLPGTRLIGGGGVAGTTTISILPYALAALAVHGHRIKLRHLRRQWHPRAEHRR